MLGTSPFFGELSMDLISIARRDFKWLGWSLLTMAAAGTAAQYLFSFLFDLLSESFPELYSSFWPMWIMTFVPIYLLSMPAGAAMMHLIPRDLCVQTRMPMRHFASLMLISFPVLYGGNIIGTLLSFILSGGTAQNALLDYVGESPLMMGILSVLVAPFAEEYIFRKQIIDRIGRYGEVSGILVSALTFALFHMNLFQFFYAFGLGILLAYAYTRTRLLRYPVAMHMIINFMGSVLAPWILMNVDLDVLMALSDGSIDPQMLFDALPGLMLYMAYSGLLMLLSLAGAILLVIRWKKRVIFSTPAELPAGYRTKTIWGNWGMILFILFCLGFTIWALL